MLYNCNLPIMCCFRHKYTRHYKSLPTKPDKATELKFNNKMNDLDAEKAIRHSCESTSDTFISKINPNKYPSLFF